MAPIIVSLKSLAAKILSKTADEIPGETVTEVIDYITANYTPPAAG